MLHYKEYPGLKLFRGIVLIDSVERKERPHKDYSHVFDLAIQGIKYGDIGKKFHLSEGYISEICRRYGIYKPRNKTMHQNEEYPNLKPFRGIVLKKGFALLSPEMRREMAHRGGKASQQSGKAHQWDSTEAQEAGRKGGKIISQNREHMSKIGRLGGLQRNNI